MRITLHRMNFHSLRERFKNEIFLAALIVCAFAFLFAGMILFIDTYDALCNRQIQQTKEVLEGVSVQSGHNWWENKELRLKTGSHEYSVDFMPYLTRIFDEVDTLNEELRHKSISIQYRNRLWNTRSAVGIVYNGKVYIDPEETLEIWERRVGTRDMFLILFLLIDLLVLVPMSLGVIRFEKKGSKET